MTTVYTATKEQLIDDLSPAYRENNDIESLSVDQLIDAWKQHGIYAGTVDWDIVTIEG